MKNKVINIVINPVENSKKSINNSTVRFPLASDSKEKYYKNSCKFTDIFSSFYTFIIFTDESMKYFSNTINFEFSYCVSLFEFGFTW